MRATRTPCLLFCFLAFLGAESFAHADTRGGSAVPQIPIPYAKPEEAADPAISAPPETVADCARDAPLPGQPVDPRRPIKVRCMPQNDAFKQAAEAASYLAIYEQSQLSQFGSHMMNPEEREKIEADVRACVNGDPSCNAKTGDSVHDGLAIEKQNHLMQALVQYNFNRELKAQMLENQTRFRNMETLTLPPEDLKALGLPPRRIVSTTVRSDTIRKNTFRLDPHQVHYVDPSKLTGKERDLLGPDFNRQFGEFVDAYTSSTGQRAVSRWNYVPVKTSALGGDGIWITQPDSRTGEPVIDKAREEADRKSQEKPGVEEIVSTFKEHFKDLSHQGNEEKYETDSSRQGDAKVTKKSIDAISAAYGTMGFGMSNEELARVGQPGAPKDAQEVAVSAVVSINKAINDREKKIAQDKGDLAESNTQRVPSSAGGGLPGKPATIPSVTLGLDNFDKFLDEIWPTGAPAAPPSASAPTQPAAKMN